jgi:hypothetical protein
MNLSDLTEDIMPHETNEVFRLRKDICCRELRELWVKKKENRLIIRYYKNSHVDVWYRRLTFAHPGRGLLCATKRDAANLKFITSELEPERGIFHTRYFICGLQFSPIGECGIDYHNLPHGFNRMSYDKIQMRMFMENTINLFRKNKWGHIDYIRYLTDIPDTIIRLMMYKDEGYMEYLDNHETLDFNLAAHQEALLPVLSDQEVQTLLEQHQRLHRE